MKYSLGHLLFLATTLFLASLLPNVVPYPLQEPPNEAVLNNNEKTELKDPSYISPSNLDPRMRLYLLWWLQNVASLQKINDDERPKTKRTCRLNAGLSHSCDYKDTLDAIHEGMYFGSDMTPGKK